MPPHAHAHVGQVVAYLSRNDSNRPPLASATYMIGASTFNPNYTICSPVFLACRCAPADLLPPSCRSVLTAHRPLDRPSNRTNRCRSVVGPVSDGRGGGRPSSNRRIGGRGRRAEEDDGNGRRGRADASDATSIHFGEITATDHARARARMKQVPAGAKSVENFEKVAVKEGEMA